MTVGFMAFFCSVIAERLSVKLAYRLVAPLLILGVFSVWYWHHYQIIGQGDLRLYVFVQFFPMLAIPYLLLVYPAQYSQSVYLWSSLASYLLAKVFELSDKPLYALTQHAVSGHTIKHLFAAFSAYLIYCYLKKRAVLIEH